MNRRNMLAALLAAMFVAAMGAHAAQAQSNVLPMTVKPGPYGYTNGGFTFALICTPGTSTCQAITVNLVDTGSFGLRIFAQTKQIYLPPEFNAAGGKIAECTLFTSFSAWGGIKQADVYMAGEPPARNVPIQVIASGGLPVPASCSATGPMLTSPQQAGFKGLLGVGVFAQDCGPSCAPGGSGNPGWYYSCSGGSCTQSAAGIKKQVTNPVAMLPQDNQGVLVQLPAIGSGGAPTVSGSLIFGINSESNNQLGSTKVFNTDGFGEINTNFNNGWVAGFFDTGSNGLFFNDPSIPMCADGSGWFCPTLPVTLSAINASKPTFVPSKTNYFTVDNATDLFLSSNAAYNDLAAPLGTGTSGFDWGLPFFFGRSVYVGIYQMNAAPAGPMPFFAFRAGG